MASYKPVFFHPPFIILLNFSTSFFHTHVEKYLRHYLNEKIMRKKQQKHEITLMF